MTANVHTVSLTMRHENGSLKNTFAPGTIKLPQATQGYESQTVSATSAEAAVSFSTVTTPGMLIMHSLESSTTGLAVDFGVTSSTGGMGTPFGTLEPTAVVLTNLNSTSTLRMKIEGAAAGTVKVEVICFEA